MVIEEELRAIVGADHVFSDVLRLKAYGVGQDRAAPGKFCYIVQPETAKEIQSIVRLANNHKLPVTPYSSGIHFFNSTAPFESGIILELGRMKRILAIDERNRMVRIEPGVIWGQLQEELQQYDLMAVSPLLPHPLKSALTIYLEREPRLIPKFEYTDPLVTMEVVLPDGELFRTGSTCVPGFPDKSISQGVNPSGPGDFMWNRLFMGAQGTLGVVTWANCKVEHRPKVNKTFFLPFKEISDAVSFIYKIQRREVGEECLLLNSVALAAIAADKWPADFQRLSGSLAPWTVILVLGGGRRLPEGRIEYEEEALREVAGEVPAVNPQTTLTELPGLEIRLPDMLRSPWPEKQTYWKFACKGACQDLFFLAKLNQTQSYLQAVMAEAARHNFPQDNIGVYIQPMAYGGACHLEFNFYYDPTHAAEADMVNKLYSAAAQAVFKRGAFFSRPYGLVEDMVYSRAEGYAEISRKLKGVLDANNIMSPGRLCY